MSHRSQPKKKNPEISEIARGLFLGNSIAARRVHILREHNIQAVVSVPADGWARWSEPSFQKVIRPPDHLFIRLNDSETQDVLCHLDGICNFIDHVHTSDGPRNGLVHCDQGVSRSATVMIAYLMRTEKWSFEYALAYVQSKRLIRPKKNFLDQLRVWEAVGYEIWADESQMIPKREYQAYLDERAIRLQTLGLTGAEPVGVQSL